jgi:Dyp-type peroxidase family
MAGVAMNAPVLDASDIQGLLRTGYGTLPHARFTVYSITTAAGGRQFLAWLADRTTPASARKAATATQVALTLDGMRALAVPEAVLSDFSLEFTTGMSAVSRSRFLGDIGDQDPSTWRWGGPAQPAAHLLVMAYGVDPATLNTLCSQIDQVATANAVDVATRLDTATLSDHEPFGFRDGISQPNVTGLSPSATPAGTPLTTGEFVLGYPNAYGKLAPRPILSAELDPGHILPLDAQGSGGADLGLNGSYLVLRTLRQDVDGFWAYVKSIAPDREIDFAARLVGRWPSGAPLVLTPDLDQGQLGTSNDFGYHDLDPAGLRCPIGAHIRRANPRDSLDPNPGSSESVATTNRHRLLRRGRKYGADAASSERGLHFVALNADLSRQFEFVQHSWLNSPKFDGLYDEGDPIAGAHAADCANFTAQDTPIRSRYHDLPSFVSVRGGAYFFLPGLRAIRYLAADKNP